MNSPLASLDSHDYIIFIRPNYTPRPQSSHLFMFQLYYEAKNKPVTNFLVLAVYGLLFLHPTVQILAPGLATHRHQST
jgi:hypothetical protein